MRFCPTSITHYDSGIYLANNKDTFTYENKTASEVFRDCCTRFGLPMGEVAECTYKIPELTKPKTTAFDTIADALSLDFDATGIRHYVSSAKGKLSLLTRREKMRSLICAGVRLSSGLSISWNTPIFSSSPALDFSASVVPSFDRRLYHYPGAGAVPDILR